MRKMDNRQYSELRPEEWLKLALQEEEIYRSRAPGWTTAGKLRDLYFMKAVLAERMEKNDLL
jgi:hypothetical protein